jgi:TonB family protein
MMKLKPASSGTLVLSWANEAITCDGKVVTAADWIAPHPLFAAKKLLDFPVTIGFAVDATGRAVDIRVIEGGYVEGTFDIDTATMRVNAKGLLESLAVRDLMPSLRASRFAEGAPQMNCRVVYSPRYDDAAEIARDMLARITVVPGIAVTAPYRDKISGGDCNTVGWPAPLLRGFPDFRKVSASEGARKWSWVRFDIDAEGNPTNAAIVASSGDANLDAESLRAYRISRFAGGPRTGCAAAWWRDPGIIPAPPAPDASAFPDHRSCEALRSWDKKPELTYPQAYNERKIEGWAVLGFDIAADGSIGNVRVLSAQPSEEFGGAGAAVLQSGRFKPGDRALTRCIEKVRFVTEKAATPAGS